MGLGTDSSIPLSLAAQADRRGGGERKSLPFVCHLSLIVHPLAS